MSTALEETNPKILEHQNSSGAGLHRRRMLYLIRHGEAKHNVLEALAQKEAKLKADAMGLSDEETLEKMEQARTAVLQDHSLRDAPLTEKGRQQARDCGKRLQELIKNPNHASIHSPTEAMVSPLTRTLETCRIILDTIDPNVKAHIREEIQERQTRYPPDTPQRRESLLRYTQHNDRFLINHAENLEKEEADQEAEVRESKEMLRERASKLFDLLVDKMEHRHILIVSHKGYLRELERGVLGLTDSPLFENAELRVYRVTFTRGERKLESLERLA
mmetsp:Transcript_17945/g.26558  ORF Transcript_17945/g.26558 Transcript_17945/m.26558 type:complete len:276 (-) Transcript_17945:429-1256(-)|eukprot:CAMPEP_0194206730 /NCGR_PEP_ID=MMETSP0156-20130528/5681_1 /TAXON_ID=33649 /ORGANISM="Thalassionema nitzschioides, Strain L26-B" /LENGTH=275 /DNA_ID=CAMNT_0038933329 /DNA_START=28 /DNA_END=855 /DNA_ORIENTATION=-